MSFSPFSVASTLVHRALATPFAKAAALHDPQLPLPHRDAVSRGAGDVDDSAADLGAALAAARRGHDSLARALCDPGAGFWSLVVSQFLHLNAVDQDWIIESLPDWAASLFDAAATRWATIAGDVGAGAPWLLAEPTVVCGALTRTGKPVIRRPADALASWPTAVDAVDYKIEFGGHAERHQAARHARHQETADMLIALPRELRLPGDHSAAVIAIDSESLAATTYEGHEPWQRRSA